MKKVNGAVRSPGKFGHGRSLATGYGLCMSERISVSRQSAHVKFWEWFVGKGKINPACEVLGVLDKKTIYVKLCRPREVCLSSGRFQKINKNNNN